jgi:hypothetical protein
MGIFTKPLPSNDGGIFYQAIDEGEGSASHPSHFTPRKESPVSIGSEACHCRVGLDAVEKGKLSAPARNHTLIPC